MKKDIKIAANGNKIREKNKEIRKIKKKERKNNSKSQSKNLRNPIECKTNVIKPLKKEKLN